MPPKKRKAKPKATTAPNDEKDSRLNDTKTDKETANETDDSDFERFSIPYKDDKSITCERRRHPYPTESEPNPALLFTHGAGGGLTTPAMLDFAEGFTIEATIVSFQGNMNLKSRVQYFHAVIAHDESFATAALGGRSMGARAAVLAATEGEQKTAALVLVSYPLAGGKTDESREQILLDLPESIDVLFISGTKDAQCDLERLADVRARMSARSWMVQVDGADHGMSWKWKEEVQGMRYKTGTIAAKWLRERDEARSCMTVSWNQKSSSIHLHGWYEETQDHEAESDHNHEAEPDHDHEAEPDHGHEAESPPQSQAKRRKVK